jgi:hypothetical protein
LGTREDQQLVDDLERVLCGESGIQSSLINGSVSAQSFRLPVVAVAMLPQFAE